MDYPLIELREVRFVRPFVDRPLAQNDLLNRFYMRPEDCERFKNSNSWKFHSVRVYESKCIDLQHVKSQESYILEPVSRFLCAVQIAEISDTLGRYPVNESNKIL